MKSTIVLLAVMCCVAVVRGKHINNFENEDSAIHHTEDHTHSRHNPIRHRRHRRYSSDYYNRYNHNNNYNNNNAYDYNRDYDRRDDNRHQQEVLYRILDKLNEISIYMKMSQSLPPPPPPPPQIIYIVPQCKDNENATVDVISKDLFDRSIDRNRYWGSFVKDGSRPITFKSIKPDEPTVNPPPVEHGTVQAGTEPGQCKAAIIVCCQYTNIHDIENCFARYDCKALFNNRRRNTCSSKVVEDVIEQFAEVYAPRKNPNY